MDISQAVETALLKEELEWRNPFHASSIIIGALKCQNIESLFDVYMIDGSWRSQNNSAVTSKSCNLTKVWKPSTFATPVFHITNFKCSKQASMVSEMSMPAIKFSLPPASYFLPPGNVSKALPPPPSTSPFYISPSIYLAFLDKRVPITIALVYALTVHILNSRVSNTKPAQPYSFAKTKAFHYFVIAHNLFLAVYSGWTFIGMFTTLARTIPALTGNEGVVGTVHSLCKIREDNGSGLWQEGLAFYGWLFYLSKFYEVIDTAIILAKGKKSSTLQTCKLHFLELNV